VVVGVARPLLGAVPAWSISGMLVKVRAGVFE
jgi:hypothetical protein